MNPKITLVGAGSASFGLAAIKGILECPDLDGIELMLHDIDEPALRRMAGMATLLAAKMGGNRRVSFSTRREEALEGAKAVVLSVAVQREELWKRDRDIALSLGINHYAENGGPASMFHLARNLGLILPIARDMERLCPDAWLLNYTNPVPRVGTALKNYTKVKWLGICHQLGFGYFMAGVLLSKELGIELPEDYLFRWRDSNLAAHDAIMAQAEKKLHIHAAGLNHFTWVLKIINRETGEDLYPLLRERNRTFDPAFEPLTRKVFELFDVFPVPGDCHLVEYLPYTHNVTRGTWQRYDVQMYDFEWSNEVRRRRHEWAVKVAESGDISLLSGVHTERAEGLIAALLGRRDYLDEAVDIVNDGAITNLPKGAVVEVPCAFNASGPHPVAVGALPEVVAELCRRQTLIMELTVKGLVEGDRQSLRQALALDPMVDDPDLPDQFLEKYADLVGMPLG